MNSEPNLEVR